MGIVRCNGSFNCRNLGKLRLTAIREVKSLKHSTCLLIRPLRVQIKGRVMGPTQGAVVIEVFLRGFANSAFDFPVSPTGVAACVQEGCCVSAGECRRLHSVASGLLPSRGGADQGSTSSSSSVSSLFSNSLLVMGIGKGTSLFCE